MQVVRVPRVMREISEKEYQNLHGQVSIKSIYEKKKGKEVSLDHFLFVCHDTSKQLSELDHRRVGGYWPGLQEDLSEVALGEGIAQMINWYKHKYPHLNHKGVMDVAKVVHVAKIFAYFEKDFKRFVELKTGECLEDHLLDQYELAPPWTYLKDCLTNSLNQVGSKIWTYFIWAYGISPPSEVVHISEVPPMSRFRYNQPPQHNNLYGGGHPNQLSPFKSKGNNKTNKKKRFADQVNYNSVSEGNQSQYSHAAKHQHHNTKPNNHWATNKNHKVSKNHKKNSFKADKIKKKEVIALVDQAINQLEQSQSKEVVLAPQNSFYRRIQHQYIVDLGYKSKSCGDDQNRAVKIIRKSKS